MQETLNYIDTLVEQHGMSYEEAVSFLRKVYALSGFIVQNYKLIKGVMDNGIN